MRQIGVGTPGGAEALAIFHQLHEKNCFGMIEWKALREAASRFFPKHTAQQHGNIGTCRLLNRKGSRQCRRIKAQSKETLMGSWSAAWPLEWWQQRQEEASLRGKRRALFPGLA